MNRILKAIEEEGSNYGLTLSKKTCELFKFGSIKDVQFSNGEKLKPQEEVTYLGINLNDKGDPVRELIENITVCNGILRSLHAYFWSGSDSTQSRHA